MNKPVLINIQSQNLHQKSLPRFALFEFAFRPLFLLSVLFSALHLLLWVMVWLGKVSLPLPATAHTLTPFLWHGHEMIFGYGFGVIAGFLLTAVTNWTGQKTLTRRPLIVMVCLWVIARIAFMLGGQLYWLAMLCDLLFAVWVLIEFTRPVMISQNHRQWGFVSKLLLIIVANGLFYLGLFGYLTHGERYGVYLGLYLALAIVLVMGRRVIPFFTKRALGLSQDLKNPKWLDISSLILFTLFCLWDTFYPTLATNGLMVLSLVLFALYGIRLFHWYAKGLFKHSLIWSLWLANAIFFTGFLLKSMALLGWVNPFLYLHAFALGGIGLMTLGMMSRVSLGHTGRNVFAPPRLLVPIFIIMIAAALTRVLLPILLAGQYKIWIMLSAMLWVLAAFLFLIIYSKILVSARADNKPG